MINLSQDGESVLLQRKSSRDRGVSALDDRVRHAQSDGRSALSRSAMNGNHVPDMKNELIFELIKSAVHMHHSHKPLVFGITGQGGAGKTTFSHNIVRYLGRAISQYLDLDDYLISREERKRLGVTGYFPAANKLGLANEHIRRLCARGTISKPRYDHSTGMVLENEVIYPTDILVLEGVTTLYPEIAGLIDVSFFLDASDDVVLRSRIERDGNQRGYSQAEAIKLFHQVKPDFEQYIAPSRCKANVIISVDVDHVMTAIHIDPALCCNGFNLYRQRLEDIINIGKGR